MRTPLDPPAGGSDKKVLYLTAVMLFFWAITDSIMSFVSPLIITERGISATHMGLIIGTSSIAGATFDFLLCRFLPNTNFRRVFGATIVLAAFFPLIMWKGTAIWMFFIAMGVWGLYFDLYRVGTYDFVSRLPGRGGYSAYFGSIQVFISIGVLLAPFLAGFLIGESVGAPPLIAALLFLGIAALFYVALLSATQHGHRYTETLTRPAVGLWREIRIWRKLGGRIMPVLLISLMLSITNAFFWTIGPLFSETFTELGHFTGLFLASFIAPALVVGWFAGKITVRFGQRRTAVFALLLGSLVFTTFGFIHSEIALVAVNFVASFFIAAAYPAVNGAYANFIAEARTIETEIETIEDSSINMGWVIGPISAGFISDMIGYQYTFVFLGILGVVLAIFVLYIMPRSIRVSSIAKSVTRQRV